jgi:hypothetical protein
LGEEPEECVDGEEGDEEEEELTEEERLAREALIERIVKHLRENPELDAEEEIEKEWKKEWKKGSKARTYNPKHSATRPSQSLKSIQYKPRPGNRVVNITGSKYRDRYGHKVISYMPREMLPVAQNDKKKAAKKKLASDEDVAKKQAAVTKSLEQPVLYSQLFSAEDTSASSLEKPATLKTDSTLPPIKSALKSPQAAETKSASVIDPDAAAENSKTSLDTLLNKVNNQTDSARKSPVEKERSSVTQGPVTNASATMAASAESKPKVRVATAAGTAKPRKLKSSGKEKRKGAADKMPTIASSPNKLSVSLGAGTIQSYKKPDLGEMRNLRDQMNTTTGHALLAFHPEMGKQMQEEVLDSLEKARKMGKQTRARQKEDHTWTLLSTPGFYEAVGADHAFESNTMATHVYDDRYTQQMAESDRSQCLQKNPIAQWANEAVKCNFKIFVPMGSLKV